MKRNLIEFKASYIKKKLSAMFMAVNRSTVLPILECCLIKVKDGVVTFLVSDLTTTIELFEKTDAVGDYSYCVNARQLLLFFNNAIEDDCRIYFQESHAFLESGDFRVKLPTEPSEDFVITPKCSTGDSVSFNTSELFPYLQIATRFTSSDNLRPAMTGVFLKSVSGVIELAATDAHVLYSESTKVKSGIRNCILENKSVKLILANMKEDTATLQVDESNIYLSSESCRITTRTIDAKYPDYTSIVQNAQHKLFFYLKRTHLVSFLKLAAAFVNKSTNQLVMNVSNKLISVSGGDCDFDIDFSYKIPVMSPSNPFEDFKFAVNLSLLKKILDAGKDEYVKINHSTTPIAAILIDGNFVLMPLLTNN